MSVASEITRLQNAKADIKTAIEAKGVTIPSNATLDDYDTYIGNIPSGSIKVEEKDVNFYDCDGEILYSYTTNEFLALTEMPPNPTRTGLIAQGWNWSLSDAKTYVTKYKYANIGQQYITNDGKTRIYITIPTSNLSLIFGMAVKGTATIEWGDGTSDDITGTSFTARKIKEHNYQSSGDYIISISTNDTMCFYCLNNDDFFIYGTGYSTGIKSTLCSFVNKIEVGSNCNLGKYSFYGINNCKYITIPKNITSVSSNYSCNPSSFIVLPENLTSYPVQLKGVLNFKITSFKTNISGDNIKNVTIPSTVETLSTYTNFSTGTKKIIIPDSITAIDNNSFTNLNSIIELYISDNVTSIGNNCFTIMNMIDKIKIPSKITSIGNNCFNNMYCVKLIDFRDSTQVPTIGTGCFGNMNNWSKIVVPDNLYNDWIAAENWSNLSTYIIRASDYTE